MFCVFFTHVSGIFLIKFQNQVRFLSTTNICCGLYKTRKLMSKIHSVLGDYEKADINKRYKI